MSVPLRIAIVDDDQSVRKALCRLLRSAGFDVHGYDSAMQFVGAAREGTWDCLILDVHMPQMSGLDLQRHLAALSVQSPIVFMTAYDTPELQAECLKAGACHYLRKPIGEKAILDAIQAATSQRPRSN